MILMSSIVVSFRLQPASRGVSSLTRVWPGTRVITAGHAPAARAAWLRGVTAAPPGEGRRVTDPGTRAANSGRVAERGPVPATRCRRPGIAAAVTPGRGIRRCQVSWGRVRAVREGNVTSVATIVTH